MFWVINIYMKKCAQWLIKSILEIKKKKKKDADDEQKGAEYRHVYSHRYYNIAYYYVKPRFRVCRSVSKKPPIQMFLDDMEWKSVS